MRFVVQGSNVFAGKHGFITPRDLFRWAGRGAVGYQQVIQQLPHLCVRLIACKSRPMPKQDRLAMCEQTGAHNTGRMAESGSCHQCMALVLNPCTMEHALLMWCQSDRFCHQDCLTAALLSSCDVRHKFD